MENKLQPKLRFKEFSGEWEEKKLGECSSNVMYGMNAAATTYDGKHKYIRITDINEKNNLYVPKPIVSPEGEISEKFRLIENDILFARTGASTGKSYLYNKNDGNLYFAGFLIKFHLSNKMNSKFIFNITLRESYRNWLEVMSMRSGQPGINAEEYKEFKFNSPPLPEQEKIASFLSSVDSKIEKLEKKRELLGEYKKGIMHKIFSQEIRFKEEDGEDYPEWEEKKLGEIFKIGSGKDYKHLSKGNIPVFGTGGYMLAVDSYLYDGETVCIGRKGTIDKPFYFEGKFWTVDTLFYTHSFKGSIPKFINFVFQKINWKLYNEASGVPSLSKSTIEKIKIEVPCLEEQEKISNFLSSIDKKIDLVAKEIESNKEFKKGLLQQMFC